MKKLIHIWRGWAKARGWIQTTPAETKLSELRLSICKICEEAEESTILELINGDLEEVNSLKCLKCKCPCLQKSLVIEEYCPLKKW